jgi:DNA-binding GntR family transcriptional regulator
MPVKNLPERIHAIQSTAEVIAQSLKEMIYEAELKPGQPLVQETIAAMFQVSRIPVRDALQLLIQMGIAVNVPRRGVIVRPLSHRLLDELFEVRQIVEGAAARLAAARMTPGVLRDLRGLVREQTECLKAADVKRQERLDDLFHRTLYGAIGNDTLVDLIFATWERTKQARCASTANPEHGRRWIAASIRRHKLVLEALASGDGERACRAVVSGIDSSKKEITACLEQMGWIEPPDSDRKENA